MLDEKYGGRFKRLGQNFTTIVTLSDGGSYYCQASKENTTIQLFKGNLYVLPGNRFYKNVEAQVRLCRKMFLSCSQILNLKAPSHGDLRYRPAADVT